MKSIYRILLTFVAVFGLVMSASAADFSAPATGNVYRIWNLKDASRFVFGTLTTNQLSTVQKSRTDKADLFLIKRSGTGFTIRNIRTGRYVSPYDEKSNAYPLGNRFAVYKIQQNASKTGYNIVATSDDGYGMGLDASNKLTRQNLTTTTDGATDWQFEKVEFTDDMKRALNATVKINTGVYYIINDQRHKNTNYYAGYNSNRKGLRITSVKPNKNTFHGYFLFTKQNDTTFTIRDLETGKFVQKVGGNNQILPVADEPYSFVVKPQTQVLDDAYFNIFIDVSKGDDWCWHAASGDDIVRWHPLIDGNNRGLSPSEWKIEKDTSLTNEQIKARLAAATGYVTPEAGKSYRIYNNRFTDRVLYQNYADTNTPLATQNPDSTYIEVWTLEAAENNTINFKNAITGQYISNATANNANYKFVDAAPTSGFSIKANTSDPFATRFNINNAADNNVGLNDHEGPHNVLGWNNPSDQANIWLFKEVTVDATELAAEQNAYKEQYDIIQNKDTYAADMLAYFNDKACTDLKAEFKSMSDADLKAKMQGQKLPTKLQETVLKIKNDNWKKYPSNTNWEKRFRIQDYKPYTDVTNYNWSGNMGLGYLFGRITGPTGITAKRDSTLFIFVDKIPENTKIEAELIPMGSATGNVTTLTEGMNVVLVRDEYNLNLRYWVNTYDNLDNGKPYTLAHFPTVKIHVEGGEVNGVFDRTVGDNNDTWKVMKSDGLAWAKAFDAKAEYTVLHMPSDAFKISDNDDHMADLVDMWNSIPRDEQALMGFRQDYADRFNGILTATGVDHNYMYASTYGTYYNYNTLGDVLNYKNLSRRDGMWWGPAHEFGHNHQQLFNMAGMTEISNNVFSNQVLFKEGRVTSRSEYGTVTDPDGVQYKDMPWSQVTSLATYYANNTDWIDYNLWACTQMMYKLYMYYHAAGNDTTFYSKVFHLMKESPMTLQKTPRCTGLTDYLKFATTCCKAANEDLSDLFRAWSFYHPITNKEIGDYGTTIMNTTQEMIDQALAEMHSYPKKGGNNMMFIEDHIRPTKAIYPGHADGELRQNYNNICAFGRMGDMGNWDQFCPDSQGVAKVQLVNKTVNATNGRVTVETKPLNSCLVGFKVYDGNGNLIWFANQRTFDIPGKVIQNAGGTYYVKACSSNGSEVNMDGDETGIDVLTVEKQGDDAPVDVYTVSGTVVRKNVPAASATAGLPAGLYIVGKNKVVVR